MAVLPYSSPLRTLGILLILTLLPVVAMAQATADTTQFRTTAVTVQADREDIHNAIHSSRLSMLNDSDITLMSARQCADILRLMPGVMIRDYGGLGGLKTVSLRGTSAAQTAVYIDGIRMNASQNGMVDFSNLPAAAVSSVSVRDAHDVGIASANAMGGVVVIRTMIDPDSVARILVRADMGSFSELGANVRATIPLSSTRGIVTSVNLRRSDGDYPFQFNDFGSTRQYRRSNASYRDAHVIAMFRSRSHDSTVDSHTRVYLHTSSRGAPGAVTQGNVESSTAQLSDSDLRLTHETTHLLGSSSLQYLVSAGVGNQHYVDTSRRMLGIPIDNRFTARDLSAMLRFSISALHRDRLFLVTDAAYNDLRGDLIKVDAAEKAHRIAIGCGLGYESSALSCGPGMALFCNGGLRFDFNSDVAPFVSPRAGLLLRIGSDVDLRCSYSYAYRLPSFNELYYQNYGTRFLRPEYSHSLKLGIASSWRDLPGVQVLHIDVDAFQLYSYDLIVAVPRSPLTWSASNVDLARSMGLDAGFRLQFNPALVLRCGYTYQQVVDRRPASAGFAKQIPFTPSHLAYAQFQVSLSSAQCGLQAQFTGRRYSQTDNAAESVLDAFTTLSTFASYAFDFGAFTLRPRIDVENVLDVCYSVIPNYPMPGRMIRIGLAYEQ